jgi:hypothetical protein
MCAAGLAPAELRGLRFVSAALLQAAGEPLSRQVMLHGLKVGRRPPLCALPCMPGASSAPTHSCQPLLAAVSQRPALALAWQPPFKLARQTPRRAAAPPPPPPPPFLPLQELGVQELSAQLVWDHHVLPCLAEAAQRPGALPDARLVACAAFALLAGIIAPPGGGGGGGGGQHRPRQGWQGPGAPADGRAAAASPALQQLQQVAVVVTSGGQVQLGRPAQAAPVAPGGSGGAPPCAPAVYLPRSLGAALDLAAAFPTQQWLLASDAYAAVQGVGREAWAWLFGQLGVHASLPLEQRTWEFKGREDWHGTPWDMALPSRPGASAAAGAQGAQEAGGAASTPAPAAAFWGTLDDLGDSSAQTGGAANGEGRFCDAGAAGDAPGDAGSPGAAGAAPQGPVGAPPAPEASARQPLPPAQLQHVQQALLPLLDQPCSIQDTHCPQFEQLASSIICSSQPIAAKRAQLQQLLALLDSAWGQHYSHAAVARVLPSAEGGAEARSWQQQGPAQGGEEEEAAQQLPSSFMLALWQLPWLPDSGGGSSQPATLFAPHHKVGAPQQAPASQPRAPEREGATGACPVLRLARYTRRTRYPLGWFGRRAAGGALSPWVHSTPTAHRL